MPKIAHQIEFIGGPYDGYKQVLMSSLHVMAEIVALPVSRDLFRLLNGEPCGQEEVATSVAVYPLAISGLGWRHRYVGAAAPKLSEERLARLPQSARWK